MGFMDFPPIHLENGTPIRLRNPGIADARRILAYRKKRGPHSRL